MKRFKRLLNLFAIILVAIFVYGCNKHEHSYVEEVLKATCTEQGYTIFTCECGDSYTGDYKDALGHDYQDSISNNDGTHTNTCSHDKSHKETVNCTFGNWVIVTEATAFTEGKEARECSYCGYKEERVIPATHKHEYASEFTVDKEATCLEDGLKSKHCLKDNCNDVIEETVIPALGHTIVVDEKKEPTCTTAGLTEGTHCSVCNEVLKVQEIIDALGHSYEATVTAPTCTEDGYTTHTCSACSDTYKDSYVEAIGHSVVVDEKKEATCTIAGLTEGTHCSVCNEVLKAQEVIEALGHSYESKVTNPTCTEDGYTTHTCTLCSDTYKDSYVEATGHSYLDAEYVWSEDYLSVTASRSCKNNCNHTETETVKSVYNVVTNPTCILDGEATYTSAGFDNKGFIIQIYKVVIKATGHSYDEVVTSPTCETQGYTTHTCHCGDSYIDNYVDAIGHKYNLSYEYNDDYSSLLGKAICEHNNEHNISEIVGVTYSVIKEATCTVEGLGKYTSDSFTVTLFTVQIKEVVIEALGHNYNKEVVAPSCEEKGYDLYTCHCGDSYKDNYVEAFGHNYGEVNYVWSSNNLSVTAKRVCSNNDSHIETETVSATYSVVTSAECEKEGLGRYTSNTFTNSAFSVQEKEEVISSKGHKYRGYSVITNPTFTSLGVLENVCANDSSHIERINIPTLNEKDYKVETVGTETKFIYSINKQKFQFIVYSYDLNVEVNNNNYGEVTASGKVYGNSVSSVSAVANDGYTFFGWFIGDELVSEEATYIFIMPENEFSLEARFTSNSVSSIEKWDGTIATKIKSGKGTEASPYLITSGAELAFVASQINGRDNNKYYDKYYKLVNDIDLNNINWDPIGSYRNYSGGSSYNRAFQGNFDGDGHVIYNLSITEANSKYYCYFGLFGIVHQATIKNLGIENVNIGHISAAVNAGGLAAYIYNTPVTNCYVTGNINSNADQVGGLIGNASINCEIRNCYANVNINVLSDSFLRRIDVGGLLGEAYQTKVVNCYAKGSVIASATEEANVYVGGVIGHSESSTVMKCYSAGSNISGTTIGDSKYAYVGGVIGGEISQKASKCYYFEDQVITSSTDTINENCTIYTKAESIDKSFYTEKLGFDESVWNINSGILTLKMFESKVGKTYYQTNIVCSEGGSINYNDAIILKDESIVLVATANDRYAFVGWHIDNELVSKEETFTYTPSASKDISAVFELVEFDVTVSSDTEGINVLGSGVYRVNEEVVLTAASANGYAFVGWYIDDEKVSDDVVYRFVMTAKELNIIAKYIVVYDMTVTSNNEEFGIAQGSKQAYENENVIIKAVSNDGYKFFGWFSGDILISEEEEYTFTMPGSSYSLEARFTKGEYKEANIWDGTVASSFSSGSGTQYNPYVISTGAELAYLASIINSSGTNTYNKYYRLANNIDLNDIKWNPIGVMYTSSTYGSDTYTFKGIFDGNGHVIYNLNISTDDCGIYRLFGLFGCLSGGTIKNLGVENVNINLKKDSTELYIGGLVGYIKQGTVTNCYVKGNINGKSTSNCTIYAGGITGYNNGTISYSYTDGSIKGESKDIAIYVGGVAGYNYNVVQNCFSKMNVEAVEESKFYDYAGGIAGYNRSSVMNCYRYEKQVVSCQSSNINEFGTLYTEAESFDKTFYKDKLRFDLSYYWSLKDNELTLNNQTASSNKGKTFYQLIINNDGNGVCKYSEAIVQKGQKILLSAAPNKGYKFAGWYLGDTLLSSDEKYVYEPNSSAIITAKFELKEYYITTECNKEEIELNVNIKDYYHYLDYVTLSTVNIEGYVFDGWYVGDEKVSGSLSYSFTMSDSDLVITVRYFKEYSLTLNSNSDEFGSVTGSNTYYETENVTVNAESKEGYLFFGWFNGDELVSDEENYQFIMPPYDFNLEARFTKGDYELIESVNSNVWDGTIASSFAGGSGTEEDPYLIATGAQLAYLGSLVNAGSSDHYGMYYKLISNIDLNNIEWTPIGVYYSSASNYSYSRTFCGSFDGDGYVVSNLKVSTNQSFYRYFGLFGMLNGKVKNLGVENVNISITSASTLTHCGGISGYGGTITNCYTTGSVSAYITDINYAYAGGICGKGGTITNCYSSVNVHASSNKYYAYAGGLTGEIGGYITNSFASGNVSAATSDRYYPAYFGGLVGYSRNQGSTYVVNSYRYENQSVVNTGKSGNRNEDGLVYTESDSLNSSFYFDTLEFDPLMWTVENNTAKLISGNNRSKVFYQLFVEESFGGYVNNSEAIIKAGSSITLKAFENEGYEFVGWYLGDTLLSTEKEFTFKPESSNTIKLVFKAKSYNLNISSNLDIDISGDYVYSFNDEVTLNAPKIEDYTFTGWFIGEEKLSSNNLYVFNMPSTDLELIARYEEITLDIWNGSIATKLKKGTGTEEDPYLISTGAELAFIASQINGTDNNTYCNKHYRLVRDIDLKNINWNPIGCSYDLSSSNRVFAGAFDGNGHIIYNLSITKAEMGCYFGLFGRLNSGTIKNLGIENININITWRFSYVYVGGITGYGGTVTNCYTRGNITATTTVSGTSYAYVGGITGYNGIITNCYSTANVTAVTTTSTSYTTTYAGGIIGYGGTVTNCYTTGNVISTSGSKSYAGGIIAYGETVTNCYTTGNVTATSTSSNYNAYAGGIAGCIYSGSTIANCYTTGNVKGKSINFTVYVGGIVGYMDSRSTIINCYTTGDVTGTSNNYVCIGGITGYVNASSTITNCYTTGDVTGTANLYAYAGGITGDISSSSIITNCYKYDKQRIISNTNNINTNGIIFTDNELNDNSFYIDTLKFDVNIWDIDNGTLTLK